MLPRHPAPVLTCLGEPQCGACGVWGHALPKALPALGPTPGLDNRPSSCLSAGLAALAPATAPSCLPAAPGARSSGPGHCSCPLAGLLSSGHTASGWISHPTSDSEKGKGRLRGALARLHSCPALGAEVLDEQTLTVPLAKAPASSPCRSALAASPGSGSLSTALALRTGADSYCFVVWRARGHRNG